MIAALLVSIALAAEPVWVPTDDGAEIVLTHHAGAGEPVVLCHGISSNARFWDLDADHSLAEWLAARGYDVWNLDLRGHGLAERDEHGHRQRAGWTVDDYGTEDLPTAFAYVLAQTGASQLHYVGHSMGGMVLAVYLATHPDPPLASATVVGSPLDFRDPDALTAAMLRAAPWMTVPGFVPTPLGGRFVALFGGKAPFHADAFLYNPADMADPAERRAMLRTVVSPLSRGEIRQFGLARDGEFVSADGKQVYRTELGAVHVPMLFFAGRADRVVNPDRVKAYYDAVGSPNKAFVVLSVANGASGDYGHLDMGLGDHAADDVFPRVLSWMQAHPTPGAPR